MLKAHLDVRANGFFLEIASGTGQHVAAFSEEFKHWTFQPSEPATDMFASISAWAADKSNVKEPVCIDCTQDVKHWGITRASVDAMLCVNMTHISPWEATAGLVSGAGYVLRPNGLLFLYGPFKVDGEPTTESNGAFDTSLRNQNSAWGLRDIQDIDRVCADHGLHQIARIDMPANNFTLLYRKQ